MVGLGMAGEAEVITKNEVIRSRASEDQSAEAQFMRERFLFVGLDAVISKGEQAGQPSAELGWFQTPAASSSSSTAAQHTGDSVESLEEVVTALAAAQEDEAVDLASSKLTAEVRVHAVDARWPAATLARHARSGGLAERVARAAGT
eukprot:scaffold808_cov370-Prasinococcus_capsulatus_cf.AAC.25